MVNYLSSISSNGNNLIPNLLLEQMVSSSMDVNNLLS